MAAFSVATGITLLRDEGVLPPNPAREAVAFTSAADTAKLEGQGFALKRTATALAMEDETADGTVELSSAAMEFLAQALASPDTAAAKAHTADTAPQKSATSGSVSDSSPIASSAAAFTATAAPTSTSINVLA